MNEFGIKSDTADLQSIGLGNVGNAYWNLTPAELVEETIVRGMGILTESGALAIDTGEFTGRSPKDRFIVCDDKTESNVWWGNINVKFSAEKFDLLYGKITAYLSKKDIYVRDAQACADPNHRLKIRVVTEYPWSNQFAYNMFISPSTEELKSFTPDWHILCAPGFYADPELDGTRQHNFAVINFTKKTILIGGTGYTGEIKKGIFSVLNYILPLEQNVLSMHCSANIGKKGDTAIFFGLSGTGKTTLSADPNRQLIGDDEHGWVGNSIFNFEGGCYAKCIGLSEEKEPEIWNAVKFGAILENICLKPNTSSVDFEDDSKTENTRVSYPIEHCKNIAVPSIGQNPKNIFFLTCDAYGVLPPISRLSKSQAMYHFISGYTAKVAGTEAGITEPQTAFSACYGAPFLPLHPTKYAEMLGQKMTEHNVNVWLVNTGWTGGGYGVGNRMNLKHTRAMITAALEGKLDNVEITAHEVFGLSMPNECENVPAEILHPRNTWADKAKYDETANNLAGAFVKNFQQFEDGANQEILDAAPKTTIGV